MKTDQIVLAILGAILVLNIGVSLAVAFSSSFTARQKAKQAILVWLLPFFGAATIGLFLIVDRSTTRYRTNTVGARDLDSFAANLPGTSSRGL